MKVSKVIEKFHIKLELDLNEAETLFDVLDRVNPNSQKHRQFTGADTIKLLQQKLCEAGVGTSHQVINGTLTFAEF